MELSPSSSDKDRRPRSCSFLPSCFASLINSVGSHIHPPPQCRQASPPHCRDPHSGQQPSSSRHSVRWASDATSSSRRTRTRASRAADGRRGRAGRGQSPAAAAAAGYSGHRSLLARRPATFSTFFFFRNFIFFPSPLIKLATPNTYVASLSRRCIINNLDNSTWISVVHK